MDIFRYTEVYLIYQLLCIVNVYILMNLDLSINCDTTTTNKVINLCITSKRPPSFLCSFFNGKNIWHEMPSKQVLSAQHSIVNYGAMLYRSLKLICIETLLLYRWTTLHFPLPSPQATTILFCFHDFDYFRYLIYVESCGIYPSGTDISLSVASPVHPFCCKGRYFLSVIKLISYIVCTYHSFFAHLSVEIWVVWILLQWIWEALMSLRSWLQFFWICTQKWD